MKKGEWGQLKKDQLVSYCPISNPFLFICSLFNIFSWWFIRRVEENRSKK